MPKLVYQLTASIVMCFLDLQRYGGSEGEERELYVDVKPVEMVGTDMITRKQRYG